MLWCIMAELSLIIGLIMLIVYGLFSLSSKDVNLCLSDCYFFCSILPIMFVLGSAIDFTNFYSSSFMGIVENNIIDYLLVLLTIIIMSSFKTFESKLLILMAFIGQFFMLHCCDLVSFYICLEIQNFSLMVLCGLQVRTNVELNLIGQRPLAGVESSIKYLLLSAFASGFLLFWFSVLYLQTGMTCLTSYFSTPNDFNSAPANSIIHMFILLALMFKLGAAPLHIWMIDIYIGVKRQLVLYISTAPKLSLIGFWLSTWHSVWTDFTILIFVAFSMIIGCFGAYNQPILRSLFAFSTVNEIGLMLMAIETAGFHSLLQHLSIYIVSMILLWNNADKRLFAIIAISLAGLPPLSGFFGKAWIFGTVCTGSLSGPYLGILIVSLFCTGLSLVYYLRVFRLFFMNQGSTGRPIQNQTIATLSARPLRRAYVNEFNTKLTSFCIIFLIFAPIFYIKPFVL
ncbi:NADH dehydrogenase subunit 2 (mitochondrion) [Chlamydomonas eustigma]|uniref:NADH dehydrogenase subunit 2 n=1 Tax=Chlamydomonas eustigma TaxID=1157962 RepID=A0A250XUH4_9CHLO|nr:NADH dehydrogenase subunit 2 [Chlamydomonas eustigma]|eukprot:GAX86704.1 NADH dehydrogenase subunit 2 (mitochondrion) [Chlamydomonas eustigma]